MAVLTGFRDLAKAQELSGALTLGTLLCSITVPARTVIGGLDVVTDQLDTNVSPLVRLTVGDPDDTDRLLVSDDVGVDGGTAEWRPDADAWYRYATSKVVSIRVSVAPATSVTTGDVALTLYTYPSATHAEAAAAVLAKLGILAEGETPRAPDDQQAKQALAEVHDNLAGRNLARRQDMAWPVTLLPMFALRPYATLAADLLSPTYGLPLARQQMLAQQAEMAIREMRRQCRKATAGEPVAAEYF